MSIPNQDTRLWMRGLPARDVALIRLIPGRTNRDIARYLHYAEHTIRNRMTGLLHTTGARCRTELAVWYMTGALGIAPEPFIPPDN